MRLFGIGKKPNQPPSHKLLQIWAGERSSADGAVKAVLDEMWAILRELPRSKISGELPAYGGLEIQALKSEVCFYLWVPVEAEAPLRDKLKQIFPEVILAEPLEDYSREIGSRETAFVGELEFTKEEALPIIANPEDSRWPTVIRLLNNMQAEDRAWLQILIRPLSGAWKKKINKMMGKKHNAATNQLYDAKAASNGFRAIIRIAYVSRDAATAKQNVRVLARAFQRNQPFINDFKLKSAAKGLDKRLEYYTRLFIDKGLLLNTAELSSLIELSTRKIAAEEPEKAQEKAQSRFDKLVAEAENNPSAHITKTSSRAANQDSGEKPKRPPRGVISLAKKSSAKQIIGKVATSKTEPAETADEVTIKLH